MNYLLFAMSSETSIPIDKITRDRLKTYGVKGETYRDILTRLMDSYDENSKRKLKME